MDSEEAKKDAEARVLNHFGEFVAAEKARIEGKHDLQNNHKNVKAADLVRFSKTFQLKTPMPEDLAKMLGKPRQAQEKQDHIKKEVTQSSKSVVKTGNIGAISGTKW